MLKRPFFWLGLLLGVLATLGPRKYRLGGSPQKVPNALINLVEEAVVVCDASGTVTYANAAAQKLSYSNTANLAQLYYPSGQRVPPGQVPMNRALRTGQRVEGAGYRYRGLDGSVSVLDILAQPVPAGGVTVVFRDRTAEERLLAREARAETQQKRLHTLCQRLCDATDAAALGQAIAESAYELLEGLPEARAEVFVYDNQAQTITRLAAMPKDRPQHPLSPRKSPPPMVAFDALQPLHWQVYVAKQTFLGTEDGLTIYALPLIAGGQVRGHLSISCRAAAEFEETGIPEEVERIGAVAALALMGPQGADQAAYLAAQVAALRRVIRAVAASVDIDALADLMMTQVQQITRAVLCTVTLRDGTEVRLRGNTYQDALLRPERHTAADPNLWDKAAQRAMKTGKTVQKTGVANPAFEIGPWRALAGVSGQHSVLAVPLAAGQGAMTVYTLGTAGFSEDAVKFTETLGALFPRSLPASQTEVGTTL